ncbi:leucine-rich repeat domain-containing protein [Bacillus tianshenii]|uniref:leucine-rich repeat domain-containing protein n=1 Tax=Sutcliffiella tianshenii TaxID=1463404 RepID=UPI001CD53A68|nr:leucine-rich repeat domain-containing protein [Bacillus tianshenii]MCA1320411.1 leucine-rich repeat domain-containing protein [Bacillus tianshenii]
MKKGKVLLNVGIIVLLLMGMMWPQIALAEEGTSESVEETQVILEDPSLEAKQEQEKTELVTTENEELQADVSVNFTNEHSFQLEWYMYNSPHSSPITLYEVYLNGVLAGTGDNTYHQHTFEDLTPLTTYTVKIIGYYNEGNSTNELVLDVTTDQLPEGEAVVFEDEKLEALIQEQLGLSRELYLSDMKKLEYLYIHDKGITSLKGLEGSVNLTDLLLSSNEITDLEPISTLTNLDFLSVGDNNITDITPIKNMKQLTYLDLSGNPISAVSILSSMTKLGFLNLSNTNVSDIDVLLSLPDLHSVGIAESEADFSFGSKARKVVETLYWNNVNVDVLSSNYDDFPLILRTAVPSEGTIRLEWKVNYNQVPSSSDHAYSYKIYVDGDLNQETSSSSLLIKDLEAATEYEIMIEMFDKNTGALITTVHATEVTNLTPNGEVVNIPDKELRRAIQRELDLPEREIYLYELLKLTKMNASYYGISDLTGLEKATNLHTIYLEGNNISDVTPLVRLENLHTLNLRKNSISDLTPFIEMTWLTTLELAYNNVSDITPLSRLAIQKLDLSYNPITDISALKYLPGIKKLQLNGIDVTSIDVLLELPALEWVELIAIKRFTFWDISKEKKVADALRANGVHVVLYSGGPPGYGGDPIWSVDIKHLDSTSIEFEWEYIGLEDLSYYMVWLSDPKEKNIKVDANEKGFKYTNLEPNRTYSIVISGYMEDGTTLIRSYNLNFTTPDAPIKETETNSQNSTGNKPDDNKNTDQKTHKLPTTATNSMNFIAGGLVLLLLGAGGAGVTYYRKKKAA